MFTIKVEQIHENPDIVLYKKLLTKEECEYLITKATPFLEKSATMSSKKDNRRTSSTAYTNRNDFVLDPIMISIKKKCSLLCGFPVSHIEPPQIVRYFPEEKFMAHLDAFEGKSKSLELSGQRDYTFFIYLNEPSSDLKNPGGETSFMRIPSRETPFMISPEQGTAVFWRNIDLKTGNVLRESYHEGLPPKEWTKWGMNVWIRHLPFKG
jgi:hypothetical protein